MLRHTRTRTPITHLDLVVAVAGHVSCLVPKDLPLPAVREGVPDAGPFPMLVPGALSLEGGAAHAPGEACRGRRQAGP